MKKLPIYISLLLLLTCAKEDSQDPGTTPNNITPKYTLTASAVAGGSVTPSTASFNAGTQVSITATPSSGYQFVNWSNGSSVNPITIIINSDFSITANFEVIINSYTLTVSSTEGGSVNSEGGEYNEGTEVTLTASVSEGYRFTGWSDGSTEESISITLTEDTTLEALFELIPVYTVIVTSTEGGSISSEGGEYQEGTEVTLTATPDEGYRFIGWSDGVTQSERSLNIESDLNIEALFEKVIIYFETLIPENSYINMTTSYYNTNYYIPNIHIPSKILRDQIDYKENCNSNDCEVKFHFNSSVFIDFNNDNKLDFIGWLSHNMYLEPGKYVLIEDVFNDFNASYQISDEVWFGGRFEINDFNGDGIQDVLVSHTNAHDGKFPGIKAYQMSPFTIMYFNLDGSFTTSYLGEKLSSYGQTSGDIDNDGDVDIIVSNRFDGREQADPNDRIYIYENLGNGNFELNNELFEYYPEYYNISDYGKNHWIKGMELYDIDGDGFLDLITGQGPTCNSETVYEFDGDIRIFWGDNSNKFMFNRSTLVQPDCNLMDTYSFSFLDYNLDGKQDILYSGPANDYHNQIGILKNNGNRQFSDVTSQQIDHYIIKQIDSNFSEVGFNQTSNPILPLFTNFSVIDVDNDGDFDLFPLEVNNRSSERVNEPNNIYGQPAAYWQNNSGFFNLVINY